MASTSKSPMDHRRSQNLFPCLLHLSEANDVDDLSIALTPISPSGLALPEI